MVTPIERSLGRIAKSLEELVSKSPDRGIGIGVPHKPETEADYKKALQIRVMDAEEELHDAREALDEHLAFLKRIHSAR